MHKIKKIILNFLLLSVLFCTKNIKAENIEPTKNTSNIKNNEQIFNINFKTIKNLFLKTVGFFKIKKIDREIKNNIDYIIVDKKLGNLSETIKGILKILNIQYEKEQNEKVKADLQIFITQLNNCLKPGLAGFYAWKDLIKSDFISYLNLETQQLFYILYKKYGLNSMQYFLSNYYKHYKKATI